MRSSFYLGAIGDSLGSPLPIDQLRELLEAEDTLEMLERGGLRHCLRSTRPVTFHAEQAMAETLSRAEMDPCDIGLVVCATESAVEAEPISNALGAACSRMGLRRAHVVGTWGSGCSNLVSAIRIARHALAAGRAHHVMVVVADVAYEHEARVLAPALTVFSDGAAACLLSNSPRAGFKVSGLDQFVNNELLAATPMDRIRHMSAGVRQVCSHALGQAGKTATDCKHLVMNNYTQSVQRMFLLFGGFRKEQAFNDMVATHAHVGTADTLLNLKALSTRGDLCEGDVLCLLSTGTNMCGALALEAA